MEETEQPIIGLVFEKNHDTGISEYSEEYLDIREEVHHCDDGKVHQVISLEIWDEGQALKNHDGSEVIFPSVSLTEDGAKELIQRLQKFLGGITVSSHGIESYIPPSEAPNLLIRSSGPDASVAVLSRHESFKADIPMDQAKKVGEWMGSLNAVDQANSGVWVY